MPHSCVVLQASLLDYASYKAQYDIGYHALNRKGKELLEHVDPQQGTSEEVMTYSDFEKINAHWLAQTSLSATQDRAIGTHLFATTGRGDEARSLRFADLLPPRPIEAIGIGLHTSYAMLCLPDTAG